jgi:hypothetical protein
LDAEAVEGVAEGWMLYADYCFSAAPDDCMEPFPSYLADMVMGVAEAAYRQGQGVIVHSDCTPEEVLVEED